MLRFAILSHDYPSLHWDFLLENGDKCRTWRLLNAPDATSGEMSAEEIADHRLFYLDYEGPVSGQRGSVTRWDAGTFEWLRNEADHCLVLLDGHRWHGRVHLRREQGAMWVCRRDA
ncbi:DNA polymerase ligase N-terminal domain-containing protein [Schlesneria paludicola]|uniref:DNA polymerase ligase N-terminal domain-containing protein n=1 Tax=Schlesneria paludicola TaxID=360056 RepID=UPI00029A5E4C|nr:DNA polymerase ligase N-terminal domain-containing protein [Schlesneria paludicola]